MKHPVDIHVGKRLRTRRLELGMTQQQLAECVGVKFQQIQKYESGCNRVSASRLWEISAALETKVDSFFDGYDCQAKQGENGKVWLSEDVFQEIVSMPK